MKQKFLFTLAVISVLVFTAYQLNIEFFKVNSESEINSLRDLGENEFEEVKDEKDPGWHEEWFDSRKNEKGIIPRGLRNKWYSHDKLQTSRLKSSNISSLSNVQELGPYDVGGRTRAILVDQSNSNRIFSGGVSGGLWRSTNGGNNWTPLNDQSASLAVSCITQNPLNNNIIYYGTGEGYGSATAGIPGGGIYKSTNGGNSFSLLSNTDNSNFDYNTSIAHSRTQSSTVVVGTRSNGVWRTTDGGTNWSQVLNTNSRIDEVLALPNGRFFVSIDDDGIYRSTNNGASFTKLTSGLPASSAIDRVEIAFCLNTQNTLYAAFAASSNVTEGVYRTDDGGNSWTQVTLPDSETKFTWYCYMIGVDPNDPDRVVMGAQKTYYSENGGSTWSILNTGHADNHVVAIDENNQNTFYIGNDGGIYEKNWNSLNSTAIDLNDGYHVTQFYGGDYYPSGDNFVGGTQDNGTNRRLNNAQKSIMGGDGGYAQVSLQNGNLGYAEYQNGVIRRSTNIQATTPSFVSIDADITDNDHFIAPFEINRADGEQVYFCSTSRIWRTTNSGDSWTAISGSHSSMRAIGVRNATNPTIYYGGSNGNIYRLDNAATNSAANEVDLTASVPSAVNSHFISDIKPHPTNNTIAYVTFSSTDNDPRVYRVNNSNTASPSWTSIHGNLPQGLPCNSMEVDPTNDQNLFVGTDFGLYSTSDGGNTWLKETDIPNVPVFQVQLRASDRNLFVFTHGRGIFSSPIGGGGGGPTYCESSGGFPQIFISNVTLEDIDNDSGSNGYADYTNGTAANLSKSQTYTISTSETTTWNFFWSAWIDYNQNGTFENGELVLSQDNQSSNTVSQSFTVPASAATGETRMRVSVKYYHTAYTAPTPCETITYGEVEDYTINISNGPACTVGAACNDNNACTVNDVYDANCNCAGTYVDADGDGVCAANDCNDNNASVPTTPGTACNDGNPNTINDVILADGCTCEGTISTGNQYCESSGGFPQIFISNVTLEDIDNDSGSNGYADYTAGTPANLSKSQTYTITTSETTNWNFFWRAWIDYNQNGTFENAELILSKDNQSSNTVSQSFTVPASATTGETRMRVSLKYYHTAYTAPTPCETITYGEVEDYTIDITTSSCNAAVPTASQINNAGNVYCNFAYGICQGHTGINKEFELTNLSTGVISTHLSANHYAPFSGLTQSTNYRYRVRLECGNTGTYGGWSPYHNFTTTSCKTAADWLALTNYPNPFNDRTTIEFSLPDDSPVTLTVYDLTGRVVTRLLDNEQKPTGHHRIEFDGSQHPSGMYIYKIKIGEYTGTGKMNIIK